MSLADIAFVVHATAFTVYVYFLTLMVNKMQLEDYRVTRLVAEKVLINILLHVSPIHIAAREPSW